MLIAALWLQGASLPPAMELGRGKAHGTIQGSHLAPVIDGTWNLPDAQAEGSLTLERETIRMSARAPALDMSGVLHVRPAAHEDMKRVVTQAEMAELTALVLEGAEVDADLKVRRCPHLEATHPSISTSHPLQVSEAPRAYPASDVAMPRASSSLPHDTVCVHGCLHVCVSALWTRDVCCLPPGKSLLPLLITQLHCCRAWMCCPSCLQELQLISIWPLGSPCGCV